MKKLFRDKQQVEKFKKIGNVLSDATILVNLKLKSLTIEYSSSYRDKRFSARIVYEAPSSGIYTSQTESAMEFTASSFPELIDVVLEHFSKTQNIELDGGS